VQSTKIIEPAPVAGFCV